MKTREILTAVIVAFAMLGLNASAASEYCNRLVDPPCCAGEAVAGTTDAAYFTWETNDAGEIVVTIAPFNDNNARFRGDGMNGLYNLTMNGEGAYFTSRINDVDVELSEFAGRTLFTQVIFTPQSDIPDGAAIRYEGVVEMWTTEHTNLWPTLIFEYTYGTTCANAPTVTASKTSITLSPKQCENTFEITGENLTPDGSVSISVPRGLSVTPQVVDVDAEGNIASTTITVTWEEGYSAGGVVSIFGGGLIVPQTIPIIASSDFSEYCNKVISQNMEGNLWHAYMSINLSEDKTQMIFSIAPVYEDEGITKWNANSIPASNVLVYGGSFGTPTREMSDNDTKITLTFDAALQNGYIVAFGSPLVWTTTNAVGEVNGNCFIDPIQYYMVGPSCECDNGPITVVPANVSKTAMSLLQNNGTIVIQSEKSVTNVQLFDTKGQLVSVLKNTNIVNTSTLSAGIYILKIQDAANTINTFKIVLK